MSHDPTTTPDEDRPIDVGRFAWPESNLDPVTRMRALAAGLPHSAVREEVLDVDFDRAWEFIADLENNTPRYEGAVNRVRVLDRNEDRWQIESRTMLGFWLKADVVMRPGWCLMDSRAGQIGFAAHPESAGRTRLLHFERSRFLTRVFRPYFVWNVAGDFRRLRDLLR